MKKPSTITIFHGVLFGTILLCMIYSKLFTKSDVPRELWELVVVLVIAIVIYKVARNEKFNTQLASR